MHEFDIWEIGFAILRKCWFVGRPSHQSVRQAGQGADQRFMREEDWSLVPRRIRRREKLLLAFEGYETNQHRQRQLCSGVDHFLCWLSANAQYAQYFFLINLIMKLEFGSMSSFSLLLSLLGDRQEWSHGPETKLTFNVLSHQCLIGIKLKIAYSATQDTCLHVL